MARERVCARRTENGEQDAKLFVNNLENLNINRANEFVSVRPRTREQ